MAMNLFRMLLLLAGLSAHQAYASAEARQSQEDAAHRPSFADAVATSAEREATPDLHVAPSRPLRAILGAVGGTTAGVLTTGATVLLACAGASDGGWCILGGLVLGLPLGVVGLAGGVTLVGHLLDGNGNFFAALGGAAVGAAGAALLFSAVASSRSDWVAVSGLIVALALPGVASAVAYELTSDDSRTAATMALRPSLMPGGAGLSLVGSF